MEEKHERAKAVRAGLHRLVMQAKAAWRREKRVTPGHVQWGTHRVPDQTAAYVPGKPRPLISEPVITKATAKNPLKVKERNRRRNKAARASRKINR